MREKFVGTWRLSSLEFEASNGEISYPMGRECSGILMYDELGNMSVQIMRTDRPAFEINDQFKGSPAEIKCAFEGSISYFGLYKIDDENKTVTHEVENSLFPNWKAGNQIRYFEFQGDVLRLFTPPIAVNGIEGVASLLWMKAS